MKQKQTVKYPRYVTVYDDLLSKIRSGSYGCGDTLPGENELAAKYGVSRNTLRQALLLLAEDGYLSNHQGKGTVVLRGSGRNHSIAQLDDSLITLAAVSVDQVETSAEIRRISPAHQELFGFDESSLLTLIKTVYISGGQRIGCSLVFVPREVFALRGISTDDGDGIRAFYLEYLQTDGFSTEGALRVAYARQPVTQMLGIPGKQLLMMLDETVRGPSDEVVMTQKLFFMPEYYELSLTRKPDRLASKKAGAKYFE